MKKKLQNSGIITLNQFFKIIYHTITTINDLIRDILFNGWDKYVFVMRPDKYLHFASAGSNFMHPAEKIVSKFFLIRFLETMYFYADCIAIFNKIFARS